MKKTKYYYEHNYSSNVTPSEMQDFYDCSKIKLYKDGNKFYTYEYAGSSVSWFTYIKSEEVEIKEGIVKLPVDNKYKNGYNWRTKTRGTNATLRKKQPNNFSEEKAKRDAEFFKMREEFLKNKKNKKNNDNA